MLVISIKGISIITITPMEYKERDKRRWEERRGEKRSAEKWRKDSGGDGRSVERRGGEGSRVDNIKQK